MPKPPEYLGPEAAEAYATGRDLDTPWMVFHTPSDWHLREHWFWEGLADRLVELGFERKAPPSLEEPAP